MNKENLPLVSVVMATYNGAEYISKQLDSIINQTYVNLEILIQDDGSTDETCNLIEKYAGEDSRIYFKKNVSNLGINRNFYDLIEKASGEYIAISDQDDLWNLEKIELLLSNKGKSSLVYTDSVLIDQNDEFLNKTILEQLKTKPRIGGDLLELYSRNTVSGHACLFDSSLKTLISHLSENVEDSESLLYDKVIASAASFTYGISYYDNPLTYHRIHSGNNHNRYNVVNRTGLLEKKLNRIKNKLKDQRDKIRVVCNLLNYINPKIQTDTDMKLEKFETQFFCFDLNKVLKNQGFSWKQRKDIVYGKIYYLLFGWL